MAKLNINAATRYSYSKILLILVAALSLNLFIQSSSHAQGLEEELHQLASSICADTVPEGAAATFECYNREKARLKAEYAALQAQIAKPLSNDEIIAQANADCSPLLANQAQFQLCYAQALETNQYQYPESNYANPAIPNSSTPITLNPTDCTTLDTETDKFLCETGRAADIMGYLAIALAIGSVMVIGFLLIGSVNSNRAGLTANTIKRLTMVLLGLIIVFSAPKIAALALL